MHISLISLAALAGFATVGLAAPTAGVFRRIPADLTCTPNNQGVNVCCDQFGGCILQNKLRSLQNDSVEKREPTAVTCTPNNQGVDVCCDQFGGCELRNRLSDSFLAENEIKSD
ncbi:hypothetical protein EDB80DRAFT_673614 [Ilyonectria destructans]|nr:hypothetical protein EDB80DRAFT_673614 [Ilyonectria destructans]